MSVVLLEDTIVYVRPVHVEANSATAVPELQRVVAVNTNRIFMGGSVAEAVRGVVSSGTLPALPDEDGVTPDDIYDPAGRSVVELIADAEGLISGAADAEERGFPEDAARMRAGAQIALAAARDLLGGITIEEPAAEEVPLDDVELVEETGEEEPESAAADG